MNMTRRTIQQAAKETGLTAHTLRYYEREGLIPSINRTKNGHRSYSDIDLKWIDYITCLRAVGLSIREIRHYVSLSKSGDETLSERLVLLKGHREAVEKQAQVFKRILNELDGKIERYTAQLSPRPGR